MSVVYQHRQTLEFAAVQNTCALYVDLKIVVLWIRKRRYRYVRRSEYEFGCKNVRKQVWLFQCDATFVCTSFLVENAAAHKVSFTYSSNLRDCMTNLQKVS
jgi:hypothetical protein